MSPGRTRQAEEVPRNTAAPESAPPIRPVARARRTLVDDGSPARPLRSV